MRLVVTLDLRSRRAHRTLTVTEGRHVITVHFKAGIDTDLTEIQSEVNAVAPGITVRVIRGINSSVVPNGATDIDRDLHPMLLPLGEAAEFGTDVEYALTLRKRCRWFSNITKSAVRETFNASQLRNVGMIQYSFAATVGTQALVSPTAIAIFVGGGTNGQ